LSSPKGQNGFAAVSLNIGHEAGSRICDPGANSRTVATIPARDICGCTCTLLRVQINFTEYVQRTFRKEEKAWIVAVRIVAVMATCSQGGDGCGAPRFHR
jgi:hypothetical protein